MDDHGPLNRGAATGGQLRSAGRSSEERRGRRSRASTTRQSPPTMTRSARSAPQSSRADKGSWMPEKRSSSRRYSARSACLPGAISPMSSRPRARAEPLVAQPRARSGVTSSAPYLQPLQVQGLARFEDHVGGVVGGRAVDSEADRHSGVLELDRPSDAGGEPHVRARTVGHRGPGGAQSGDLLVVEVDAVPQPRPSRTASRHSRGSRRSAGRTSPGRSPPRRWSRRGGCAGGRRAAQRAEHCPA